MKKFPLIFVIIFLLFDYSAAESMETRALACKLDESILESDAETYFAFKGIGIINERDEEYPDSASLVTTILKGIDGKDLDYAEDSSYFVEYSKQNEDDTESKIIALAVLGDPDLNALYFKTIVQAYLPIEYIEMMRTEDIERLPMAPVTDVIGVSLSADKSYVKYCLLASNKNGETNEYGETAIGQFQICFQKDEEPSVGYPFKLAMIAELVSGQELIDSREDIDSSDDLCDCFKNDDDSTPIDCSEIDWDVSETDSGTDSETDSDPGNDEDSTEPASSSEEDAEDSEDNDDSDDTEENIDETLSDEENTDDSDKNSGEKKSDGCSMLFV